MKPPRAFAKSVIFFIVASLMFIFALPIIENIFDIPADRTPSPPVSTNRPSLPPTKVTPPPLAKEPASTPNKVTLTTASPLEATDDPDRLLAPSAVMSATAVHLPNATVTVSDISFHNHIAYHDHLNTDDTLGITGKVANTADYDVTFPLTVQYFNQAGIVLFQEVYHVFAPARKSVLFVCMSDSQDIDRFQRRSAVNFQKLDTAQRKATKIALQMELYDLPFAYDGIAPQGVVKDSKNKHSDGIADFEFLADIQENEDIKVTEKIHTQPSRSRTFFEYELPLTYCSVYKDNSAYAGLDLSDDYWFFSTKSRINQDYCRSSDIKDIVVNRPASIQRDDWNKTIKFSIGDAQNPALGDTEYQLQYTYVLASDGHRSYDEFYHTIFTKGNPSVENLHFRVKLPKNFDPSRINFSGQLSRNDPARPLFYVDGLEVVGFVPQADRLVDLSMRISFPDGYFKNHNHWRDFTGINLKIAIFIPILFLAIVFTLWYVFGRDESVDASIPESTAFYPPEQCNSLDAQYYYYGEVDANGVFSLLFYLAGKGYLKIFQRPGETKQFIIEKLHAYDGQNRDEKAFMGALFAQGDTVEAEQINQRTYGAVQDIIRRFRDKSQEGELVVVRSRGFVRFLATVCLSLTLLLPVWLTELELNLSRGSSPKDYAFNWFFLMIVFFLAHFFGSFIGMLIKHKRFVYLAGAIVFGAICSMFGLFLLLFSHVQEILWLIFQSGNPIYQIIFFVVLACFIPEVILIYLMPQRTAFGIKMYRATKAFRSLLDGAKKDHLEQLPQTDPNYFYAVLPFAYALEVSDQWYKGLDADGRVLAPHVGYDNVSLQNFDDSQDLRCLLNDLVIEYYKISNNGSGGGYDDDDDDDDDERPPHTFDHLSGRAKT